MDEVEVVDVPERSRWEAHLAGELAGIADYRRTGDVVTFLHAEVLPAFEGRGIAGAIARTSLDAVRAAGGRVDPQCPFYVSWIGKHPDYADLVIA